MEWPHLIDNSLKAHHLYQRDRHYMIAPRPAREQRTRHHHHRRVHRPRHVRPAVVRRAAPGGRGQAPARTACRSSRRRRRWRRSRCRTSSSCTRSSAGMTGTAMTEANEFWKIYKLDVIAIPTNMPLRRVNHPRPRLPHREGEVGRGRQRDRGDAQDRPADPDRHDGRGQEREALGACSSAAGSSTNC